MKIRNKKDFWSGVLFVGFGALFVGIGSRYAFGSAAKMGPAFFPQMVGGVLTVIGVLIAIGSMKATATVDGVRSGSWKIVFQILLPVVLFGVLLNALGLMVSLVLLVSLSCLACPEYKWHEVVLASLVLAALSFCVFVWALQLQFPLWPVFLNA